MWPEGSKNFQRYFRTFRRRHSAHKRFWDLGPPRFSDSARRALFSQSFDENHIDISYFELPFDVCFHRKFSFTSKDSLIRFYRKKSDSSQTENKSRALLTLKLDNKEYFSFVIDRFEILNIYAALLKWPPGSIARLKIHMRRIWM